MLRHFSIGVAALLATLVLVACGNPTPAQPPATGVTSAVPTPGPPTPAPLTTVSMGAQGQFAEVGTYIALDRGYFQEEGIDLQLVHVNTVAEAMPLLATGQLAFSAGGAGDPAFFNAVLRGVPVRIVGPNSKQGGPNDVATGIVVRRDLVDSGRYRSPKDFKGMTIGVVAEHTLAEYDVAQALGSGGLTLKDVTLTTLPFPDTVAALANKAVDAAFLVEPFVTATISNGTASMAVPASELNPGSVGNVLMLSPVFAQQHADVANRFVTAWLRGQRDYYHAFNARDEPSLQAPIVQTIVNHTTIKDPNVVQRMGPTFADPNGDLDTAFLDKLQQYFVATGVINQPVDLATVIDRSYVNYALQRLGRV